MRYKEFSEAVVQPVDPVFRVPKDKPHHKPLHVEKIKKVQPAAKVNFAHELEKYRSLPESLGLNFPTTYEQEHSTNEEASNKDLSDLVINFYKKIPNFNKKPIEDYEEKAAQILTKIENPKLKQNLHKILAKGKSNPYLQGGIITTIGALLAGGILGFGSKYGLSPTQTNILLQGILNTVIPTLVSRINGRDWKDTIKYTLASAGTGVGIASLTEKWSQKYKRSINCNNPKGFSQRAHCQGRKKK